MVLNTGFVLSLTEDCAISKIGDRQLHVGDKPRTIITPKHLNEIGISVYFANGTTVLMQTDTVALSGRVIHQEKFSDGLALIKVLDTLPGKRHNESCTQPQVVNTNVPFPGNRRTKLKAEVIAVAIKNNELSRSRRTNPLPNSSKEVSTARSKFSYEKDSWERWHAKLGHPSLTAMRKALASNPILAKLLAARCPENCSCDACLTTKVQMHPHNHGHASTGGHRNLKPGERVDFDNSGLFASSVNKKRYRFLAVEYVTGFWYVFHAALKSEATVFFTHMRSRFKAYTTRDLRYIRTDSESIFLTSKEMQALYTLHSVLPSYSSPHDHAQNSVAENGVKWLNREVRTAMNSSGAPSYLWSEADMYCVYMHNHVPSQKAENGKFVSRFALLTEDDQHSVDMELFMPFGCTVAVMLTKKQRKGPKTHTQDVGWLGILMGYGQVTGHGGAYRVLNVKTQKNLHCVLISLYFARRQISIHG